MSYIKNRFRGTNTRGKDLLLFKMICFLSKVVLCGREQKTSFWDVLQILLSYVAKTQSKQSGLPFYPPFAVISAPL